MSKIYDALKRAEREREIARQADLRDDVPSGGRVPPKGASEEDDYLRLRAALLFSPAYSDVRTIAVTATRHGEGTTRVAVGLARALAGEGDTRVLLVEANLRSPAFAQRLRLPRHPGMTEYLAGEVNAAALVMPADGNLFAVTAGYRSAVVDCERMTAAVASIMGEFHFVIVDLPPVNRYADAAIIAPNVDGVVLVVEADGTPVADAESAKRSLDRVGARIFGVVLNRCRNYVPAVLRAMM